MTFYDFLLSEGHMYTASFLTRICGTTCFLPHVSAPISQPEIFAEYLKFDTPMNFLAHRE